MEKLPNWRIITKNINYLEDETGVSIVIKN